MNIPKYTSQNTIYTLFPINQKHLCFKQLYRTFKNFICVLPLQLNLNYQDSSPSIHHYKGRYFPLLWHLRMLILQQRRHPLPHINISCLFTSIFSLSHISKISYLFLIVLSILRYSSSETLSLPECPYKAPGIRPFLS